MSTKEVALLHKHNPLWATVMIKGLKRKSWNLYLVEEKKGKSVTRRPEHTITAEICKVWEAVDYKGISQRIQIRFTDFLVSCRMKYPLFCYMFLSNG